MSNTPTTHTAVTQLQFEAVATVALLNTAALGGVYQAMVDRLQHAIGDLHVDGVTFVAVPTQQLQAARASYGDAANERSDDQVVCDVLATYGYLAAPTPLPETV